MTISVQSNKNTYTANGVLKTFAYTFKIFNDSDLTVTTITAGVPTSYTLDVDYTVTGAPGTGNVVFTTAPTDTHTVLILGTYDYLQSTDYEDGDSFPAATHENALDKLDMLLIKHKEQLNNTVQFPIDYDDGVVEMESPVANRHLMWSTDTLGSAVIVNDDFTGIVNFEVLLENDDIGSGYSQLQRGSVVDTISGSVDTNTAAIADNTTLVATTSGTLQDNIDVNTALIATTSGTLQTGIDDNTDAISNNATSIAVVSGTADTNTSNIITNASDISDNAIAIALINLNNSGNSVLGSGITNKVITLSPVQSDTDYYPTYNIRNTTDSPPTYYNYVTTATTTSGFTISFSAEIDSGNYSIDWSIVR